MHESTTVTIGLDVHASSVRLAAVRGDELLDERTLPYDCFSRAERAALARCALLLRSRADRLWSLRRACGGEPSLFGSFALDGADGTEKTSEN